MHNIYIFVYKRQMDIIKNLKSKEKLQEKARKRYQNLSEGQEKKNSQHYRKQSNNLSEDEIEKVVDYRKKY